MPPKNNFAPVVPALVYWILFSLVFLVYLCGAFLDIMDVDAAQYASISRDMLMSGYWLDVRERGQDYLDKPPLLFWVSALSFALFGVSNFSYRIAPMLFTALGAYATYGLGKLYYNRETGRMAALLLVSCQAFFLIHHDVRTDTILADSVIFAIWQIALFNEKGRWKNLLGGAVGVALAMLAKGPIGLMVPVLAFSSDFILKRKWMCFFRWQWLVLLLMVALLLFPMCWGLYHQFDLHPEKVVNQKSGVSGLYFYFWEQSFGRLTGENVWKDEHSDPFFFVHSFLWSFLPWALVFLPAFYFQLRHLLKIKFKLNAKEEVLTTGGFLLPFIALSLSHYKLPHYIYVVFPLAALITAVFLYQCIFENDKKIWFSISRGLLLFTSSLLWLAVFALIFYCFQGKIIFYILSLSFLVVFLFFIFQSNDHFRKLLFPAFFTIVGVNFALNTIVYPALFQYQSGSQAARFARYKAAIPPERFFVYSKKVDFYLQSLDFYSSRHLAGQLYHPEEFTELVKKGKVWIYTDQTGLDELQKVSLQIKILKKFPRFHISQLSLPFLNPATREKELILMYLLELNEKK